MIDPGEVAADIGLEYVAHLPSHDLPPKGLQGVVRVATRSKTETAVEEVGFEHSLENAPLAAAAGPRQWEFPTVACRSCAVLWVFRPVRPVAPGTSLPSAVCRFPQPAPPSRWQIVRCSPHRHHLLPSGSSFAKSP